MAFSDSQVEQALRESMAQGFSLEDSIRGAMEKYGVQQDQLARAKTAIQPADTVKALQGAGLREQDDVNQLLYGGPQQNLSVQNATTAAQNFVKAQTPDPNKPLDLAKSVLLNPDLMQSLTLSRQQAFDQGEASTYVDPGLEFGGYTFRQAPGASDFSGVYTPGGFTAIKKDTAPTGGMFDQLGVAGKPVETTYTYDNEGNVTGSEQRFFKGGDSGIVVRYDASGNPLDARPFDYSESWKGDVLPIANIALMALTGPAAQGLTSAFAPTLGAFAPAAAMGVVGAGRGAVLGGLTGQDVGRSALVGGVTGLAGAGLGELSKAAGTKVAEAIGSSLPEGVVGDFLGTAAREVTQNLTTELGKAVVGSVLTGRPLDLGTAATAGVLSGLSQTVMNTVSDAFGKDPLIKDMPKPLKDAALAAVAAELRGRDPGQAAINALVKEVGRSVFNAAKSSDVVSRLSGAGLQEGEPSSIWEGWDPSGGEGVSTGVEVTGQRDTGTDIASDLLTEVFDPTKFRKPGESVLVTGQKEDTGPKRTTGDQLLDELLSDVFIGTKPGESVTVTGGRDTVADVTDETTGGGTTGGDDTDPNRVVVTDTTLGDDSLGGTVVDDTVGDDRQIVDVVDRKIVDPVTPKPPVVTPVTPVTPRTPVTPVVREPVQAARRWTPIPEAQPLPSMAPGLANVFYAGAVDFGPGSEPMADPTDFQGRKAQARRAMELALEGEGGENQADDAYERLMSLAQESPAATIEELMQIIGRD